MIIDMRKEEEILDTDVDWEEVESVFSHKAEIVAGFANEILKVVDSISPDYYELFVRKEVPLAFLIAGSNIDQTKEEALKNLKLSFLRNLEHSGLIANLTTKVTSGDDIENQDAVFFSAWISFYPYKLYDYLKNKLPTDSQNDNLTQIYYDEQTAIGYSNGKEFRLKIGTPECGLFEKAYRKMNQRLDRQEVVDTLVKYPKYSNLKRALEVTKEEERRVQETGAINETIKTIRKKVRLTPSQLVQNGGTVTLVAKKITTIPKIPQTHPK